MTSAPQVSVIIIFLNEERFLREAIESVLGQRHQDWELLLVDDGSTDVSTAIAERCAEEYPAKVRYLQHEAHQNRGMSASRNLGARNARGTYISFLDADDVFYASALEEQSAILDAHPDAALVYGRVQRWHSWTHEPEDLQRDSLRELAVPPNSLVLPPTQLILLLQDQGMPSGIMVRHEVFQQVGGFEESFRGMYEDNAFLAKVCLTKGVFASDKCWYRYRKHSAAACAVAVRAGSYPRTRLAFLNWAAEYLARERITDRRLWSTLRKELQAHRHPFWHQLVSRAEGIVESARNLFKPSRRRSPSSSDLSIAWSDQQKKRK